MSLTRLKHIVIDEDNYRALKELGRTGDSFNDVLKKVLKK
jgi:predicted CopG family antitoxin